MGALIVWIDTEKAKIFRLFPEGPAKTLVRDEGPRHPVESQGRNHPLHQTDEERFYRSVVENLQEGNFEEWLLLGPALGKAHFLNHLERRAPELMARIAGQEKVGDLTDSEILERGRSFFKKHHLFT